MRSGLSLTMAAKLTGKYMGLNPLSLAQNELILQRTRNGQPENSLSILHCPPALLTNHVCFGSKVISCETLFINRDAGSRMAEKVLTEQNNRHRIVAAPCCLYERIPFAAASVFLMLTVDCCSISLLKPVLLAPG